MKTTIIFLTIASMMFISFTKEQNNITDAYERIGVQVINAFQHVSAQQYAALFPSIDEFHLVMQENSRVYGQHINEAKDEFAIKYNSEVMPSLMDAFQNVVNEGKKKDIDWNNIKYSRIEFSEEKTSGVTCIITFTSKEKEYRLQIEKAFHLNGEWRVSQFIKLI